MAWLCGYRVIVSASVVDPHDHVAVQELSSLPLLSTVEGSDHLPLAQGKTQVQHSEYAFF